MLKDKKNIKEYSSDLEKNARSKMIELFEKSPLPKNQILSNLGLFINSKELSRILFFDHIYKKIIDVPGVVMEFGTRWGQNLSLFSSLRGIYEPFNRHRKIIGFDTFTGFPSINIKDGKSDLMKKGQLSLTKNYQNYLEKILQTLENDNPLNHIKKFEICKGNASIELKKYLKKNPQTIVALAYFDFDLYKPTKDLIKIIKKRLVKGSIVGFDELNDPDSPGETLALLETFDLNNIKLKRLGKTSRTSYFVFE